MTTRQRKERAARRAEMLETLKDIVAGIMIGAGLLILFFLS
jgi:F0F1-type ATP synthase assembly protein I